MKSTETKISFYGDQYFKDKVYLRSFCDCRNNSKTIFKLWKAKKCSKPWKIKTAVMTQPYSHMHTERVFLAPNEAYVFSG